MMLVYCIVRYRSQIDCEVLALMLRPSDWTGLHSCYTIAPPPLSSNHGLYGSTSCCIIHGPCQCERAIFDPPPTASRPIFMKLEIYNYFSDATPHAKFQGATSTWVIWTNSQFDASKFLSFFSFLRHAHRSHFWTHPNAQCVIIRRSGQGSAFWGLEK